MGSQIIGFTNWFKTPPGEYLLAWERERFDEAVADMFGYHALQLGLPELDALRSNRMPHKWLALQGSESGLPAGPAAEGDDGSPTPAPAASSARVALMTHSAALPFPENSLDLVLLPHVLEFAEHPHQILREVERVLMPEGSLVISGFNPRSLWGLRRALGCKQDYPWSGHFISLPRIKDWLALLGFEVAGGRFAAYAPPFQQTKWLERCAFMEAAGDRWWAVSGGLYFLHAIKRVHGMRLIKPQWNERLVSKLLPVAPKLNNKITQRRETDSQ